MQVSNAQISPRLITIDEFTRLFGVKKTKTYELMNSGAIEKVKIGTAARITMESAERWFASLRESAA